MRLIITMDNSPLNSPDWEKVLGALNNEVGEVSALNAKELILLNELLQIKASTKDFIEDPIDTEAQVNKLRERLYFGKTRFFRTHVARISVAAAALIAIASVSLYFNKSNQPIKTSSYITQQHIVPASHTATLTLANGKRIKLGNVNNGDIIEEEGIQISKLANGRIVYKIKGTSQEANSFNTLATAKGETYEVELPDGSKVWLNATSSLTYPTSLMQNRKRSVKLDGEAYFEIAKDKAHPFIVQSKGQEIEVLGTHFNVNAYADEPSIKTTLVEGKVKIKDANNHEYQLVPGMQASVAATETKIYKVDTDIATAWKNGDFDFESMPLSMVMRQISRWYNVEVRFNSSVKDITLGGSISRNRNLHEVLEILETTGLVRFKLEGRRITVMP